MNKVQIAVAVFLFIALLLRFYFYFHNQIPYQDGEKVELETTLFSQPTVGRFNQKLFIQTKRGRVWVILPTYPQYHYGDIIQISGSIKLKSSTQNSGMLRKERVIPVIYFPEVAPGKNDKNFGLAPIQSGLAIASFFRQKMITLFQNSLSSPSSSLLLGIVFGIKESVGTQFTYHLRVSGVMHVVAASGMNVTMVIAFLTPIFLLIFRRQIALLLVGVCILFYAFVSGLQASIVRASIMGMFVLAAQVTGRQTWPLYGLCMAGFLMLFISPQTLFDIGFQLSFISTLGLLFIRPLIGFKNVLGDDMATTISAQIATLPILLGNFGSYSAVSVVVNGLVLWTVPILMIIGGIGGLIGLVFEPLGKLLLFVSLPFLIYFEMVVSWFGEHSGTISVSSFPWELGAGYYLILSSFVLYFQKTRNTRKISNSAHQKARKSEQ
ncbi:MAG: hypothetical protein A3F31_02315 [Candidatus Levybacteria bacterium RIFCSPHIGHO2_12_FULL_38_12]|nr:MAG: hypothetical protein A2770_01250 [Candidatus Levybacteria bacterium RIFCSPHIGHO2_01_FULL_38_12]OGH22717.1 MAG: hypothetical protein A3F31_02315 [Candidatus Levybacteria bacterium RIFCSPHIGHO2_12_FULL_38_12]OGH33288.1 MAG: hypothetical protein A3A47_01450 [Candidatus Levybacteria bacterium RIFCSPLOWO2_01_FULL_37_20]OGH44856.1 MAG: hypothetical protein A3J14_02470 [Candidatus Levybacteria bacterium RIFCSPLOWO2_02_FULL_37_18]OGH51736.1 MAG: hypothetical protein A3G13_01005 [Candidatus Levy